MSARQNRTVTEIGEELQCSKCDDWWPADAEFYFLSKGKLVQPCKACYYELPSVIAKTKKRHANNIKVPGHADNQTA